jgi:formate-dependent nitrite reductase membrane component NrfD
MNTLPTLGQASGIEATPTAPADITYYGRPVLKPPVWIWTIPVYFFVGGVAGAAMTLGFAVQICGSFELRRFEERCRWIGAIGGGIGTVLLISDLGRKERFLAMLRVFRPTSPMSVGSWVLALATPLSAGSAVLTLSKGGLRQVGHVAGAGAGLLGAVLATYTGVLLANTAVPIWLAARRTLPLLFGSSAAASLASVLELQSLEEREKHIARCFGVLGRAAEVAAVHAFEGDVFRNPQVGRPLQDGVSGTLWRAAKILTVSTLVLSLMPGSSTRRRRLSGVFGILGGLAVRMAVFHAGKNSALDPRATFRQQA